VYPNCRDGCPTSRRSGTRKAPSFSLLPCNRSALALDPLVTPDNRIKDVKETEDGSRWLTILDSWLPTDNGTEVDALLDELSLDGEDDNQRRRHSLIPPHYKYLSPIRVHRYSLGRCLHFIWVCIRQLESSDVQEPVDLPRVRACHPLSCLHSQLKPNSEFGRPPIYRQHDEMNVRHPIQDISAK
jgi:hypothetical protein